MAATHPLGAKFCLFCGAEPRPSLRRLGSTYAASYAVVCSRCRATGPLKPDPTSAVERWNAAHPTEPCHRCELDRDGFGFDGMLPEHTCTKESP